MLWSGSFPHGVISLREFISSAICFDQEGMGNTVGKQPTMMGEATVLESFQGISCFRGLCGPQTGTSSCRVIDTSGSGRSDTLWTSDPVEAVGHVASSLSKFKATISWAETGCDAWEGGVLKPVQCLILTVHSFGFILDASRWGVCLWSTKQLLIKPTGAGE